MGNQNNNSKNNFHYFFLKKSIFANLDADKYLFLILGTEYILRIM